MDDGDAEEQADVAPDLGVQVGQSVVPDDASQLFVNNVYLLWRDTINTGLPLSSVKDLPLT